MKNKYNFLIYLSSFALVIFIIFLWLMYKHTDNYDYQPSPTKRDQAYIQYFSKNLDNLKIEGNDSLSVAVETIRNNQLYIIDQQDRLINDFRQEMNNNINKINTWLAYGIGIIGLLGVFIPLAIQIKFNSDEEEISKERKEEFSKMKEDFEKLKIKIEQQVKLQNHSIQKSMRELVNDFTKKFDEEKNKLNKEAQLHRIWSRFMSFSCCLDNLGLKDLSEKNELLKYTWNKSIESLSDILAETCGKTDVNIQDRVALVMSLVMLNSMISLLRNSPNIEIYRQYDEIGDEVRTILHQMIPAIDNHAIILGVSEQLKTLNSHLMGLTLPEIKES